MAAATSTLTVSDRINQFVDRFAEEIDVMTNGRLSQFFERSSSLNPKPGIYAANPAFGAHFAARSSVTRDWGSVMSETVRFTVEEARERIAELMDGEYIMESLSDLVDYLKERSLELETRILQSGKVINYIVDLKTRQAVPAAQVHPGLSYRNMRALEMRTGLRKLVGAQQPAEAFGSWEGMTMLLSNSKENLGYTVVDGTGYFGKTFAVASVDPEVNAAIMRQARSRGIALIAPKTEAGGPNDMKAGMPFLIRSKSLKAADIHPGLDHGLLAAEFGKTIDQHFQDMAKKSHRSFGPAAAAKVLSLDEFRVNHRTVEETFEAREEADEDFGFGGMGGATSNQRNIVIRRGMDEEGTLSVYDEDLQEEIFISVQCLPEGEYPRKTSYDEFEGYTLVGERGRIQHLDQDRKPISDTRRDLPRVTEPENPDMGPAFAYRN